MITWCRSALLFAVLSSVCVGQSPNGCTYPGGIPAGSADSLAFLWAAVNSQTGPYSLDCTQTLLLPKGTKSVWFIGQGWGCDPDYPGCEDVVAWEEDAKLSNGRILFTYAGMNPESGPPSIQQFSDVSADAHDADVTLVMHGSLTATPDRWGASWTLEVSANTWQCRVFGRIDRGTGSNAMTDWTSPDPQGPQWSTSPLTATVPLGADLQLKMESSPGGPVQVTTAVTNQQVGTQSLDANALFPSSVLVPVSTATGNGTVNHFHAAHTGTATVSLTPPESNQGCADIVPVNVTVVPPQTLGPAVSIDNMIVRYADQSGIPPQFLKAQMAQESSGTFNVSAYRYEPLNGWVGDYGVMSRHQDFRANQYSMYALQAIPDYQDPNGIPQGGSVDSQDLATQTNFSQCCGNSLTVRQIIANNPKQNYGTNNAPNYVNWYLCTINDDFTAQTSLAASYGLLQIMFETAYEGGFRGNPTDLFDTQANLAAGKGSMLYAVAKIENDF